MIDAVAKKFADATPQIDFGNFTVGVSTAILAFITLYVAVQSTKKAGRNEIAQLRALWLTDLREAIAEHTKLSFTYISVVSKGVIDADDHQILNGLLPDLFQHETNIRLMLNPREADHVNIMRHLFTIREVILDLRDGTSKDKFESFNSARRNLLNTSTWVLKSEWGRLKEELKGYGLIRRAFSRISAWLFTKDEKVEWPSFQVNDSKKL